MRKCAERGVDGRKLLKQAFNIDYLYDLLPKEMQKHIDAKDIFKGKSVNSYSPFDSYDAVQEGMVDQAGLTPKGRVYAAAAGVEKPNDLGDYLSGAARRVGSITTPGPWKQKQLWFRKND